MSRHLNLSQCADSKSKDRACHDVLRPSSFCFIVRQNGACAGRHGQSQITSEWPKLPVSVVSLVGGEELNHIFHLLFTCHGDGCTFGPEHDRNHTRFSLTPLRSMLLVGLAARPLLTSSPSQGSRPAFGVISTISRHLSCLSERNDHTEHPNMRQAIARFCVCALLRFRATPPPALLCHSGERLDLSSRFGSPMSLLYMLCINALGVVAMSLQQTHPPCSTAPVFSSVLSSRTTCLTSTQAPIPAYNQTCLSTPNVKCPFLATPPSRERSHPSSKPLVQHSQPTASSSPNPPGHPTASPESTAHRSRTNISHLTCLVLLLASGAR